MKTQILTKITLQKVSLSIEIQIDFIRTTKNSTTVTITFKEIN